MRGTFRRQSLSLCFSVSSAHDSISVRDTTSTPTPVSSRSRAERMFWRCQGRLAGLKDARGPVNAFGNSCTEHCAGSHFLLSGPAAHTFPRRVGLSAPAPPAAKEATAVLAGLVGCHGSDSDWSNWRGPAPWCYPHGSSDHWGSHRLIGHRRKLRPCSMAQLCPRLWW